MSTDAAHRFLARAATNSALMLAAALTACAGQAGPPLGSEPPPGKPVTLPVETITPQYSELTIDRTSGPAPTVPWQLMKVDRHENRIHLSASTSGCSHPKTVRVTETPSTVQVTVTGTGDTEPCSMQYITLIGYIQLDLIGDRQVIGNAS
jgi:hypothetical protein